MGLDGKEVHLLAPPGEQARSQLEPKRLRIVFFLHERVNCMFDEGKCVIERMR